MTAYIKFIYADIDDLYIPAEIEGAKVVRFGNVNGHVKNLYIPGTVKIIGFHMCSEEWGVEGIENVYFGYGKYPVTDYVDVLHFIDNDEKVEKIEFSNYMTEDDEDWMSFQFIGPADFPNLKEVVNMPETWKLGYEGQK